ncbi:MAG: hypothetical protein E5Y79_10045 [Mesorhizobium sp.]|uniref:hypothetical protein n=1 Tax=Mesorhizobium sp. TaxID=1871066 RepID=UPI00120BE389|nr:hypothetical protein [Mesorhizobium sp.]TIL60590.1 MAG: hypothetical protein E5Y79_10045 [Mesorhizobium sp.]
MERVEVCAVRNAAEATDLKVKQIRMFAARENIIAPSDWAVAANGWCVSNCARALARRNFYCKWIVSTSAWHGGTFSLTAHHSGERIRVSIGSMRNSSARCADEDSQDQHWRDELINRILSLHFRSVAKPVRARSPVHENKRVVLKEHRDRVDHTVLIGCARAVPTRG